MFAKRILVALILSIAAFAQTDRGTITGVVTDPAGAVIANAQLELRGSDTGAVFPSATSATGNYTFSQLPVGTYQLSMTVAGFKTYNRNNIRVQGSQTIPLDVQLEVGASTESVTVSAEVTLLRTESSDVSTNVDSSRLTSLPILPIGNGNSSSHGVRNPMAVATLTPGTFYDPNSNIRVNGAPSNTMSVRVEGQDSVTNVAGASFQAQVQPSVDALQELSVQSSNYAAEFGQAGSGVFNYTIKSGTNAFHGSVYNYFSNEFLNASQAYVGVRPRQRRNNYGGSIGGPIWIPKIYDGHDRTFFFVNYEAFREKGIITTSNPTVPTDAYRAGNFATAIAGTIAGSPQDSTGRAALAGQIFDPLTTRLGADGRRVRDPFSGNIIPQSRFDPVSLRILNLIPKATISGALINNFNAPFPTDRKTPIPAVKIDHSFTSKAKISGYWSQTETAVQYCVPLCGTQGFPLPIEPTRGTFIESHTERVNFDYTVTPTTLFHLGVGFQSNDFKDTSPVTDYDVEKELGIKGAKRGPGNGARFPNIFNVAGANTGLGANTTGGVSAIGPGGQTRSIEQKPTLNISLTSVRGNHTLKFGGEGRTEGYIQDAFTNNSGQISFAPDQTANPYYSDAGVALSGGVTGFPFASFLLGQANQVVLSAPANTRGGRFFMGMFAQDTWKVSRKLTFDYGLRYDYFTYSREQYGRTPNFSATTPNPTANGRRGASIYEGDGAGRCNCSFAQNYPFAFGPRLGIAYQINTKTVLRAGFGVNYSSSPGGIQGAAGAAQTANAPGFADSAMDLRSSVYPVNPTWPDLRVDLFPNPRDFAGQPGLIDQNSGRPARQTQWSIGLQREIMRSLVVEASYVANRGTWWRTNSLNQYNGITPEFLKSQYGLDTTIAADRAILAAQVGQAAAGRFRNVLPFSNFPTNLTVARALTPFPQFTGINSSGALGKTWYDSMQFKVTKRLSHGIDASYNLTWSKELQLGADNDGGGLAGQVNDVFNRNTNKSFSSFSRPIWMVLALNYTTPKLGMNRFLDFAVKDWTVGGVLQYGSGQPIGAPAAGQNNMNAWVLRPTRAQRVAGEPLFLQDLNCHCFDPAKTQVLNPKAWVDAPLGTWAPTPTYYNDYRFQRRPRESISLARNFRLREKMNFQIRAEFTNPFNRTQIPNPIIGSALVAGGGTFQSAITQQNLGNGTSVNGAGFGVINVRPNNAVIGERAGLLVGRITF
jgi:Carboxypeptidase regulatory-like domain/TonB dependent receptor